MKFSNLTFFALFKKPEIMKNLLCHFLFIVRLAHMILHPETKALRSGLEITELILLQVNFNLSLISNAFTGARKVFKSILVKFSRKYELNSN